MDIKNKDIYYRLQTINNSENHYIKVSDDMLKSDMYKLCTPYERNLILQMTMQLYNGNYNRLQLKNPNSPLNKKYRFLKQAIIQIQQELNIPKEDIKEIIFTFSSDERKKLGIYDNTFNNAKNNLIKYGFIGEIKAHKKGLMNIYYISDKWKSKKKSDFILKG